MATIIGLATALPGTPIATEQCVNHAKRFSCKNPRQERILEELYRRTSIRSRRSVLAGGGYGEEGENIFLPPASSDDRGPTTSERMACYQKETKLLAMQAATSALADAQVTADCITHLVTISCTGFVAPGFDIELINHLPLNREVERTHVGFMGCHGALNGLRVARSIVEANSQAVVLLCTTELCSLHFQYGWSTDTLVSNSLFSDGAAAMVVTADWAVPSSDGTISGGAEYGWAVIGSGSYIVPNTTDSMMWKVGDHGFDMRLNTQVPDIVEEWLPQWLPGWLRKFDLTVSDINSWAVHPGGPRILDSVESCLTLSPGTLDISREILAECGNMSSPTILFVLERMRAMECAGPTVVLGFGPGLAIEAALLR